MWIKKLIIYSCLICPFNAALAQHLELIFPMEYSNTVSITSVMHDRYIIFHDNRSFFDVREADSNRLLYRMDLELGRIFSVIEIEESDNMIIIFKNYLVVWSLGEKRILYKSPTLLDKSSLKFDFLFQKLKSKHQEDSIDVFLFADGFGELLSLDLKHFLTIEHKVCEYGFLDIHYSSDVNELYLLDYTGNVSRWNVYDKSRDVSENLNMKNFGYWQGDNYKGTVHSNSRLNYIVFKDDDKNRIVLKSIYSDQENEKVIPSIKWIKSFCNTP